MAQEGRKLPIQLVGLLWITALTSCFNLEPELKHIYNYPPTEPQGREPYFGFSVALQHSDDNTNWVIVGAPRANSSHPEEQDIPEPGALFKCALTSDTCEKLLVDQPGNNKGGTGKNRYTELKNYGWLGGSLDSQPDKSDRQATCVCAPQWKNQQSETMNGACYFAYDSISKADFTKKLPLVDRTKKGRGKYGYGQAGFSVNFPDDSTKLIVGAPGAFNWSGSVILFKDLEEDSGTDARKKRDVLTHEDMFLDSSVLTTDHIEWGRLLGYSVTSGKFLSLDKTHYAAGAPHGADSHGKVIIFEIPVTSYQAEMLVTHELNGTQMGEYFGAALTAADINGDGLDDLVVGSPMYSLYNPNIPDIGRFQTFLSKERSGFHDRPEPHYGRNITFARFGTSLASLGDLNVDGYEDIAAGAPWEDSGAVYIFLGSPCGLKHQYSQRLSPKDFIPALRGFGMSISRGTDIDDNGYPDLAIGNFLSGQALVVKSRPVAVLNGTVIPSPSSVPWEKKTAVTLKTCLVHEGYKVPPILTVQAKLILDYGNISPRAFFTGKGNNTHLFVETLLKNETKCSEHQVTVKENKIHPEQHIAMLLEYELTDNHYLELTKRPLTDPTASKSTTATVKILKECEHEICRVNMNTKAAFIDGNSSSVVIQKVNKLRVEVSNSGEPVYLPTMTVTVDPRLTLSPPVSHNCSFLDDDKTSLQCILTNPIKKRNSPDIVYVDVEADKRLLMTNTSHLKLQVNVTGEGDELQPNDNIFNMNLQLAAQANLALHGYSEEEQLSYEFTDEDEIIVKNNAKFNHTYILIKNGSTSLASVDLTLNIPVSFTDGLDSGLDFMKVHAYNTSKNNSSCRLEDTKLASGRISSINSAAGAPEINGSSGAHSSSGPQVVSAGKEADIGTQYFNCSSSLITCTKLICNIPNWTVGTDSAKVLLELEVDLSILAKHISVKGGAVISSAATATIQSLNPKLKFIGKKTTIGEAVTYIQPATPMGKGIPWWVILLAVLGGLLLLGLLGYGLYKNGFFKREKMEELKAQRAQAD